MADVSVRPARPGEAAEIARIQRDTLAMAYASVMPADVMAQLVDPDVRAAIHDALTNQIASNDPGAQALVALEGDALVGFTFARAAVRDGVSMTEANDPEPERTGFLEQILVEPRWGRRGHGSRLLAAATEFFAAAGFTRAISWVPDGNVATISFLESAGWARDGYARRWRSGDGSTVRELRFHTAL